MPSHPLPRNSLTFTYHRKSSDLSTFVYGFVVLLLMCEIPVFVLLLLSLKSPVGRGIVLAIIALELLAVGYLLPSMLFMKHSIRGDNLILRFGIFFKGVVPLGNIASVEQADGIRHKGLVNFGVDYDRKHSLLCVMAGSKSTILIALSRPQRFRLSLFRRALVSGMMFNVDEPERLLEALRQRIPAGLETDVRITAAGAGKPAPQPPLAGAGEPAPEQPADDSGSGIPHAVTNPAIAFVRPDTAAGWALETRSLEKYYGSFKAVDGIDLRLQAGEIYGFLGPNGAGKTTTMNMVTGLLRPSGGEVAVFGRDLRREPLAAKRLLGYVAESPVVYDRLTGREFVRFSAELYRTPRAGLAERIEQLLAAFDLADAADALIRTYSQGMRRKVALAAAVIHSPGLLVLDEPTNGVDPRGAWVIKNLLHTLAEQGAAVLMSTHVLEVAENMCDRVAIIDQGRMVAEGTIADLKAQSRMPESNLEQIFLALTGPGSAQEGVGATG